MTNENCKAERSTKNGVFGQTLDTQNSGPYYTEDDNDEEFYWKSESPEHYRILNDHLDSASELLKVDVNEKNKFSLNVMIYGHVVAAAEGFLSSIFIKTTVGHEELIRKLVETDPKFSDMKFTLSQLFKEREQIKDTVAKYLHDLIFHDLNALCSPQIAVTSTGQGFARFLHFICSHT